MSAVARHLGPPPHLAHQKYPMSNQKSPLLLLGFLLAATLVMPQATEAQEWERVGGEVTPMGDTTAVMFIKEGVAVEAIAAPYADARAALVIVCSGTARYSARIEAHILDGPPGIDGLGRARIDSAPAQFIDWRAGGSTGYAEARLAIEVRTGPPTSSFDSLLQRLQESRDPGLRDALLAGDSLTVSATSRVGTIYFRFGLAGLESHESQCPAPNGLLVTTSNTRSRRSMSPAAHPNPHREERMLTPEMIDSFAKVYDSVRDWSNTFRPDEGPPGLPRKAVAVVFALRLLHKEVSANLSLFDKEEDLAGFVDETADCLQEFALTLDGDDLLTVVDAARILRHQAKRP